MDTARSAAKSSIKIVTANIKNFNADKVYLHHLLQNYDIVCIQEHWLFNFEKSNLEKVSNTHSCHAKSVDDSDPISPYQRPRGYGGTAIFSPKDWAAITKYEKDGDHRIIVLTINLPGRHLCIVNCYLPCRGYKTSLDDYKDCLTQLREIICKFSKTHNIILCGDMNASIRDNATDHHDQLLSNFCKEMRLTTPCDYEEGPTFFHPDGRSSQIDYILVQHSAPDLIPKVSHEDDSSATLNTSDHVALTACINHSKPQRRCNSNNQKISTSTVLWHKADTEGYQNYCAELLGDAKILQMKAPDEILHGIHEALHKATSASVPVKTISSSIKMRPWTAEIAGKVKKNKAAFKKLKLARINSPADVNLIQQLRNDCNKTKRDLRSCQRREHAKIRTRGLEEIMDADQYDQKLFFKLINKQRTSSCNTDTILVNDSLVSDPEEVRNAWKAYFEDLGTPQDNPSFDQEYMDVVDADIENIVDLVHSSFHQSPSTPLVSTDEVQHAVKKLNNGKAADGQGIQSEHITTADHVLLVPLAHLFNTILQNRCVPKAFQQGVVIPIPKKDKDCLLQENYRGITLTSTICKIFENVLLGRMRPIIQPKFNQLQRGFTAETSSLSAALLVSELINDAHDYKKDLFIASLDARKAFDVVNHASLLRRLHLLDIQPEIWAVIKDLYEGAVCQVKWKGELSDPFSLHQGVHQGRVSSTDFYKAYIDPILHRIESKKIGARIGPYFVGTPTCADDVILAANNPIQLQEMLDETVIFSQRERYILHPQKSQILPVCKKSTLSYWKDLSYWKMNDEQIQVVDQLKHLGVERTTSSRKDLISERIQLGRRTTYALMGAGLHGLNGINPKVSWKMICTFAEPRYLYGLEILNLNEGEKKMLNCYQKKTLKQIQHLPERTADAAVFLLLGALPVSARIEINQLSLFHMSISKESPELQIAERQLAMKSNSSKSWFMEICKLTNKYNLPSPYDLLASPPSKQVWKREVHQAVEAHWLHNLQVEAKQKTSLKYLNISHCTMGKVHPTWDSVLPNQRDVYRASIKARLLTGTYILQGNKARFNQNQINPTCLLCNNGDETREHFISACQKLQSVRDPFLNSLQSAVECQYPDCWADVSSSYQSLTQLILDSTQFTSYPNLHVVVEPIARTLIYRLHVKRNALMRELAN